MEHRQQTVLPSGLKIARAIIRTLRAARRARQRPEVIVLSPELYRRLHDPALSYLWMSPKRDELFNVPVEVDPQAEGWAIRMAQGAGDTAA